MRLQQPFLLGHQYQSANDKYSGNGAIQGLVNQFQSPADPDTAIPDQYVMLGKKCLNKVEALLIPRNKTN